MILMDMNGKVTLITGAGGGIGGGIADVFAKAGAKVYVADLEIGVRAAPAEVMSVKGSESHPPR